MKLLPNVLLTIMSAFSFGNVNALVGPSAVGGKHGLLVAASASLTQRVLHQVENSVTSRRQPAWSQNSRHKTTQLNVVDPSLMEIPSLLQSTATSLNINRDQAEALAGPFFGASLFPYLAFLYFLKVEENETPKGVTVGFATCLLFVFLTIPAAIAAQVLYGVSLADSDWLHGSAESLLTITNLVTVLAFRQALSAKEGDLAMPSSAKSWSPMTSLVVGLTAVAIATAVIPAATGATIHTPYLAGFMDLSFSFEGFGANTEPDNALTIATYVNRRLFCRIA